MTIFCGSLNWYCLKKLCYESVMIVFSVYVCVCMCVIRVCILFLITKNHVFWMKYMSIMYDVCIKYARVYLIILINIHNSYRDVCVSRCVFIINNINILSIRTFINFSKYTFLYILYYDYYIQYSGNGVGLTSLFQQQ